MIYTNLNNLHTEKCSFLQIAYSDTNFTKNITTSTSISTGWCCWSNWSLNCRSFWKSHCNYLYTKASMGIFSETIQKDFSNFHEWRVQQFFLDFIGHFLLSKSPKHFGSSFLAWPTSTGLLWAKCFCRKVLGMRQSFEQCLTNSNWAFMGKMFLYIENLCRDERIFGAKVCELTHDKEP